MRRATNVPTRAAMVALALVGAGGCGRSPTAMEACRRLEAAGVASSCRAQSPAGLAAKAVELARFDLAGSPGKTGQVLRFSTVEDFREVEAEFAVASLLSGPHRYGSPRARIFVQLWDKAPAEAGRATRKVVDAL